MKKICIDARMIFSSGIGTYVSNLLNELSKEILGQFDVSLIVDQGKVKKEGCLKNFEHIHCDAPIFSIREQIELPFKIPSCDLFFSPHFNAPIFPIRAKKRVVAIHDMYHFAFWKRTTIFEKIYLKIIFKALSRKTARFITISDFSKREIVKYLPVAGEKIEIIYHGHDNEGFGNEIDSGVKMALQIKYQLKEKFFLFVGNFKPHKNLQRLLEAFFIIAKENRQAQLIIIGNLNKMKNFQDAEQLLKGFEEMRGQVKILENITNEKLAVFYRMAMALVLPSLYEGFGMPPMEAAASNTPCILSNIEVLKEIYQDAALYVDPYSVDEMALAMKMILQSQKLRERLIDKGREIIKKYSWKESAKKHLALFNSCIDGKI